MDYTRQRDLLDQKAISNSRISIIGCGALGSAIAMGLAKMGVNDFCLFDDDKVDEVNLPNQMYNVSHLNMDKVDALTEIIEAYNTNAMVYKMNKKYVEEQLLDSVIVATDSMASRRIVWEQFQKQNQCKDYIEVRMGAEEGQIYTIRKGLHPENNTWNVIYPVDYEFYEEKLYSDDEAKQAPCTAKAVIYNVFMISSLVCRAYKAIIMNEQFPREVIFGMSQIHKYSFQIRK